MAITLTFGKTCKYNLEERRVIMAQIARSRLTITIRKFIYKRNISLVLLLLLPFLRNSQTIDDIKIELELIKINFPELDNFDFSIDKKDNTFSFHCNIKAQGTHNSLREGVDLIWDALKFVGAYTSKTKWKSDIIYIKINDVEIGWWETYVCRILVRDFISGAIENKSMLVGIIIAMRNTNSGNIKADQNTPNGKTK
jgi:hypothetical protein